MPFRYFTGNSCCTITSSPYQLIHRVAGKGRVRNDPAFFLEIPKLHEPAEAVEKPTKPGFWVFNNWEPVEI